MERNPDHGSHPGNRDAELLQFQSELRCGIQQQHPLSSHEAGPHRTIPSHVGNSSTSKYLGEDRGIVDHQQQNGQCNYSEGIP